MWRRIALTLLLASMASVGCDSTTSCPEACTCMESSGGAGKIVGGDGIGSNSSSNGNSSSKTLIEIRCRSRVPSTESLRSKRVRRLVLERSEPRETSKILGYLTREWRKGSPSVTGLEELAVINCSLTHLDLASSSRGGLAGWLPGGLGSGVAEPRRVVERGPRKLDLSENRITRVTGEALAGGMASANLIELSLEGNAIETIEADAFLGLEALESLDLSNNCIARLVDRVFRPLRSLEILNLGGNELSRLPEGCLDGLGRLRELDVSRNGLSRPSRENTSNTTDSPRTVNDLGSLRGVPIGLTVLRIADNPLLRDAELSLVLERARRLETLDASRIGLLRIPSALTRSVGVLNLGGNGLATIRGGDFDSYPLMRVLDLSRNLLSLVEEDALGRLEILERLDLSGNRLTEVPQSLPSSLERLDLRDNSIDRIAVGDLQGLWNLRKLDLGGNSITEIERGSMMRLILLTELDLSENPIKQLPANILAGPTSLAELRMSGLVELRWERERETGSDMTFPVPAPERLVSLNLSRSPALAAQLLADEAALSACKSLARLDLSDTDLTDLRSDLPHLLPQLRILGLSGNRWNCTATDFGVFWLSRWINEHEEMQPPARCLDGTILAEFIISHSSSTFASTAVDNNYVLHATILPDPSIESSPIETYALEKERGIERPTAIERISEVTTANLPAHPGMLILAGAAILLGATIAVNSIISRRIFASTASAECLAPPRSTQRLLRQRSPPITSDLW